jgi:UDP-N-acetylglucosamine transferase subunit ALG13
VVVTLGTAAEYPFRRLVATLVPLLAPGGALERATGLPVRTLWQTGGTPVDGLPVEATPFLAADRLAAALRAGDIVVAHAGAGSALGALEAGRRPLLAPRRAGRGEAGDDHQRELGRELERRGLAVARDADGIGVDDLLATMTAGVRPAAAPPPLALLP